jgi:hypothetical protein
MHHTVYGTYVDVVVAHNGQEEDPLDRQLQSAELGRIMREAYPRPLIFLGCDTIARDFRCNL